MSFAEVTGISKTMLGQIERCESRLSIATVWKIANGLKLSITALISEPVQDARSFRWIGFACGRKMRGGFGYIPTSPLKMEDRLRHT